MNPNHIDFCWFSIKHNKNFHLGECLTSYAKYIVENKKYVRLRPNQVPIMIYMQSSWLHW